MLNGLSSLREFLFQRKKRMKAMLSLRWIRLQRFFYTFEEITEENCYDVPIIINNRNRLTYLKQMLDQLTAMGYRNIFVLDNDSSYPPLLSYYKSCPATVLFLHRNLGYMALWRSEYFEHFKKGYYVYSDPDIVLQSKCSDSFVFQLYQTLSKFPNKEKAGVALIIDDLPDCYEGKKLAIENELTFWNKPLDKDVYDAPVDSTFALYRPFAFGNAEECPAIRVAGQLSAHHLTWYQDSAHLNEEEMYYRSTLEKYSSYYSSR